MSNVTVTRREKVALVAWLVFCIALVVELILTHKYFDAGCIAMVTVVTPINFWLYLRSRRR